MAKLTLGLRKLGYEDLESIAVLDKQNATNTANTTSNSSSGGGGSGGSGGDGGVETGEGNSSGGGTDGAGSVTRIVARRLLRDMRATSERYVVVAAAADTGKWGTGTSRGGGGGGSGSDSGSVERSRRAEPSSTSIRKRAGGRGDAGAVSGDGRGGAGGGGGLTFAGFMAWSSVHGGRLMLVKDLVYACLAEFGMRPAKAVQEREVIQEIFRRCALPNPSFCFVFVVVVSSYLFSSFFLSRLGLQFVWMCELFVLLFLLLFFWSWVPLAPV